MTRTLFLLAFLLGACSAEPPAEPEADAPEAPADETPTAEEAAANEAAAEEATAEESPPAEAEAKEDATANAEDATPEAEGDDAKAEPEAAPAAPAALSHAIVGTWHKFDPPQGLSPEEASLYADVYEKFVLTAGSEFTYSRRKNPNDAFSAEMTGTFRVDNPAGTIVFVAPQGERKLSYSIDGTTLKWSDGAGMSEVWKKQ